MALSNKAQTVRIFWQLSKSQPGWEAMTTSEMKWLINLKNWSFSRHVQITWLKKKSSLNCKVKFWTNFTSHTACQEVYYMPLARYQTCDSRGMTEGILTILHLGNKFYARRKSSVTHAIWCPLPSFYERGEKRRGRDCFLSYRPRHGGPNTTLGKSSRNGATLLVLLSPSCNPVQRKHILKSW